MPKISTKFQGNEITPTGAPNTYRFKSAIFDQYLAIPYLRNGAR